MNITDLQQALKEAGFEEERLDTGINYTRTEGNVELICYIEPAIEVQFVSYFRWDDNDVKGAYNLSIAQLNGSKEKLSSLFKMTMTEMPEYIGDKANSHTEVREAIDNIFRDKE